MRVTSRFAWVFFVSFYILGVALLWNLIASYLIEAYQVQISQLWASLRSQRTAVTVHARVSVGRVRRNGPQPEGGA